MGQNGGEYRITTVTRCNLFRKSSVMKAGEWGCDTIAKSRPLEKYKKERGKVRQLFAIPIPEKIFEGH